MKKLKIKKGYWYGAGSVFGWTRVDPKLHIYGVGIDMAVLRKETTIQIEVADGKYILDCKQALSFIERFRAIKTIRGKRLGIVSKSLLEPVNADMGYAG